MISNTIIKRILAFSVFFNLGGAMLFLFPASLGQLAGLPAAPVPFLYSGFCAFVILIFGGTYAWLLCQPTIDKPVLVLSAIGKAGFFVVVLASWMMGEASFQFVMSATVDLVMAGVFALWLMNSERNMRLISQPLKTF